LQRSKLQRNIVLIRCQKENPGHMFPSREKNRQKCHRVYRNKWGYAILSAYRDYSRAAPASVRGKSRVTFTHISMYTSDLTFNTLANMRAEASVYASVHLLRNNDKSIRQIKRERKRHRLI